VKVHTRLDPYVSGIVVALDPSYAVFLDARGCLTVLLLQALYGCLESARLWSEHLRRTLASGGYIPNKYDQCVFNKTSPTGAQITISLHVDDLFVTSTEKALFDELLLLLTSTYKGCRTQYGPVIGYLGMTFDFSVVDECSVTMKGFIKSLCASCGVTGSAATPAAANLFEVRSPDTAGNRLATVPEAKLFHSVTAGCLYAGKRCYPEILTPVNMCSTRVTVTDLDDLKKLQRIMRYLLSAGDRGIRLRAGDSREVSIYVDAAYGVHVNGKSHSGSAVTFGDHGLVHAKSTQQKSVTKSSTEAELVAVSDAANQGFHLRHFVLAQGYDIGPLIIYQDNMSTMALIAAGCSTNERTRHIAIRHFWLKERVELKEAKVVHKMSKLLFANLLTKPVQGPQFVNERFGLTCW
jgi:hypothetical protein